MKAHPYAEIFPVMSDADYKALKADIEANGLHEPVMIHNECILDGRNRWRACQELGVHCRISHYYGKDALGYVISLNWHRRHLDTSQRAMVAAKLSEKGRKGFNAEVGEYSPKTMLNETGEYSASDVPVISQRQAADLLHVDKRTAQKAIQILREAPELVPEIEAGTLTVSKAVEVIRPRIDMGITKPRERVGTPMSEHSDKRYAAVRSLLWQLPVEDRLMLSREGCECPYAKGSNE